MPESSDPLWDGLRLNFGPLLERKNNLDMQLGLHLEECFLGSLAEVPIASWVAFALALLMARCRKGLFSLQRLQHTACSSGVIFFCWEICKRI